MSGGLRAFHHSGVHQAIADEVFVIPIYRESKTHISRVV